MMLIHRCVRCTHPDFFHSPNSSDCMYGACVCSGDLNPEPELIPTFSVASGAVIHEIAPPGSVQTAASGRAVCKCDACAERYAELVGGAA